MGPRRIALLAAFACRAAFAGLGCLGHDAAEFAQPVQPFSLDTADVSSGGWIRWQTMESDLFHREWFLAPQWERWLLEGRDCALLRGHLTARDLRDGDVRRAERVLELLSYANASDPDVRRLTIDDEVRALEVLGREREADSLLEASARLDSGTAWALPGHLRLALYRARPLLRAGAEAPWTALDSLREAVAGASGLRGQAAAALDDSLRWHFLERAREAGLPAPEWRRAWAVSRLNGRSHPDRRARLWETLEADSLLPGPSDSVSWQLEAARHLKGRGRLSRAMEFARAIPAGAAGRAKAREAEVLKAEILFAQKKWNEAEKIYAKLVEERPKNDAQSMLQLARCRRNAGKGAQAEKTYETFRERYPSHSKTAEMAWTKAAEFEEKGKWDSAAVYYRKVDRRFRNDKRRPWVEFRVAFIDFRRGRWDAAAAAFDSVAKSVPQLWPHGGALFLKAEALRRAGRSDSAKAAFLEAIADYPVGWYAHRARQILEKEKLMPADSIPRLKFAPAASEADLAAWLRSATGSRVSQGAPFPSAADFRPLETLVLFHEWAQAEKWVARAKKEHRDDPYVSYECARRMMEMGAIAQGYREARRLIDRVDRRRLGDAPLEVIRLFYPRPYWDWVKRVNEGGVDPYFQIALVRQESIFDDQIRSPVGAIGLGQIMPYTGEPLARAEGMDWYETALLANPLVALRLSARYLRDLWKTWDGDPRWVLAEYNAGPGPTKRWAKELGGLDWDVAAEQVSYWETRDYVKRVMGNYWTYQAAWEGEK